MDANGDNRRNLTRSREDERYPVWSPDGNWLAFTRFMPDQEIFVMRTDGTQAQNLTQNPTVEEFQPVWVP
jgi:Tol biopolymer transport system component